MGNATITVTVDIGHATGGVMLHEVNAYEVSSRTSARALIRDIAREHEAAVWTDLTSDGMRGKLRRNGVEVGAWRVVSPIP